ncbi:MAG: LacI family DNA-binding transcriptional regulator [Kiritimatiellae bacterium]|nr:LacI family DNA-binding transcriptional regulator [Kiritimatiellia bacterium]
MKEASLSLSDIAKAAGVSTTTAHRALAGKGRISRATRRRVSKVAERLGYRPNLIARSLRARRTATLGVVVDALDSSFYAHVVEGIDDVAQAQEYAVLLACSHGVPERERRLLELLLAKRVDGLIVQPAGTTENAAYYTALLEQAVPVAFADRYLPGVHADSVCTDNVLGGYLAGRHLAQLGRRAIVLVAPSAREGATTSLRERMQGFARALEDQGVPAARVLGTDLPADLSRQERARRAVHAHLASNKTADGLFAVQDGLAVGALQALREAGAKVPGAVSVVGFDDEDLCAYTHPPLTTIHQPMREIGATAARLVLRRLQEGYAGLPSQRIGLEPHLVVRQSCGGGSDGHRRTERDA